MLEFVVSHASYLGIVLVLVLSGCGLPIPEEVTVVLAGVLSSQGSLNPWWALTACLVGAVLGDAVVYGIGYHFGHGWLSEHPRFAKFLRADREPRFEAAIERHALKVLVLSRFMVGIRAPVYLAAGVVRMPFRRFVLYDMLAATMVVCVAFGLSFAYGESIIRLIRNAELTLTIAVFLVLGFLSLYVYRYHRDRFNKLLYGNAEEIEAALFGSGDHQNDHQIVEPDRTLGELNENARPDDARPDKTAHPIEEKRVG